MLDRLGPDGLLFLVAFAVAPLAVGGDGSLPDLLPVLGRLPGLALVVVELVDLLEGHVLGLVDEEPNEEDGDPGEAAPDPEDVGLGGVEGGGKVRGDEGQQPVEEPVGSGGHRDTLGASLQGEQFSGDDPRCWAETCGEERDVHAQENELRKCGSVVLCGVGCDTGDRDDVLARSHTESTDEQDWAATEAINCPKTRESREDVDQVDDDLKNEGVGKLLDVLRKVRRAVVDLEGWSVVIWWSSK